MLDPQAGVPSNSTLCVGYTTAAAAEQRLQHSSSTCVGPPHKPGGLDAQAERLPPLLPLVHRLHRQLQRGQLLPHLRAEGCSSVALRVRNSCTVLMQGRGHTLE